ncbi:hypothetical protein K32_03690 [Kaistia sp. 32K]|nr:hypothetical protein K32_03690 [Kaistia sp. 32K]
MVFRWQGNDSHSDRLKPLHGRRKPLAKPRLNGLALHRSGMSERQKNGWLLPRKHNEVGEVGDDDGDGIVQPGESVRLPLSKPETEVVLAL